MRRPRFKYGIISLAMLISFFSSANAAGEWTSVTSSNFFVAGEAGETELREVAVRLEQFRDAFSRLFPKLRLESGTQTNVIIFRDGESYREFRPKRTDGSYDEGVAGYFLAGEGVNYITMALRGGKTDPYHTVFHEYIHFLLKSNSAKNEIPAWMAEGLAQYFETMRIMPDGTVILGEPPQNRLPLIRRREMLPWPEFFKAQRSGLHSSGDISRSMFYSQSWLLVHYLMQRGQGRPDDRLQRFLSLPGRDEPDEAAIRRTFDIGNADLTLLLRGYLGSPALPVSAEKLAGKGSAYIERSAEKISRAQVLGYLGDLLHNMNRLDEAEVYLRRAITGDGGARTAQASLGLLLLRRDRFAEAAKHLEIAVTKGTPSFFDHFNYAYALSRAAASGGSVSRFPAGTASRMGDSLRRSIALNPEYVESYRLLAFLHVVNGDDLDEAVKLLERGLTLRPGDENLELLLARVQLRREKYEAARDLAEKLSSQAKGPEIREEAAEMLRTVAEYRRARLQITTVSIEMELPWSPKLVFLKRSWITEADLAEIDKAREIANLNRVLERPRPGEERILGTIDRVECLGRRIIYHATSGNRPLKFSGERFDDLRLAVLVSGEHSFVIDCGVRLPNNPAVLMYLPASPGPKDAPKLTSITFVPKSFELLSPERLAAARHVVVEEDRLRRDRGSAEGTKIQDGSGDRMMIIARQLRPVQKGEERVLGTLEAVDCTDGGLTAVGKVGGQTLNLKAVPDLMPSWFSVPASQAPLACGSRPSIANVLFTFRPGDRQAGGTLVAMEFVPEGFTYPEVIGPAR